MPTRRRRRRTGTTSPNDPVAIKAFRDTYRDGVHSYLDGLYEQLTLGRELLHEKGSFIVQIGADNVHEVVLLMAEVFGRENHVATIPFRTNTNQSSRLIPEVGNWLVWFSKEKEVAKYNQLYEKLNRPETIEHMSSYAMCELPDGTSRNLTSQERQNPDTLPEGARLFRRMGLISSHPSNTGRSETFTMDGKTYHCPIGNQWRVSHDGLQRLGDLGRLIASEGGTLSWKRYEQEVPGRHLNAMWNDTAPPQVKQYVVETPPQVLERCLLMTTDPGDLVLDITCGSGAMPFQAETWGRRWIAIDVAQVSVAIARERLITNTYPYHMLKDSPEGAKLYHEMEQALLPSEERIAIRGTACRHLQARPQRGFVVERQLRVSAGTLAYGQGDEEPIKHPDRTVKVNNRTRVASPFTVESDSPYRSITPGEENGHQQTPTLRPSSKPPVSPSRSQRKRTP